MELFSTPWWSALLAIVLIDLVLAGDNALVIGLAARKVPKHQQNKVILSGSSAFISLTDGSPVPATIGKVPGISPFHEVKGWMDQKSRTKIARMAKYYPQVKLLVIDKEAMNGVRKWDRLYPPQEDVPNS